MASFQIIIVNSDFDCCNDIDAHDDDDARSQALRGALAIGTDEICKGIAFFGAEVRIEVKGDIKERFLVSIGQSPLR
jgi:hypothetical protein